MIVVRRYEERDIPEMAAIWNEVVEEGIAFPQEESLDDEAARKFFAEQTHCGVAVERNAVDDEDESDGGEAPKGGAAAGEGRVLGLYILHPNNLGRCGHLANASYAVGSAARGRGVGRLLVEDSLVRAKEFGFRVMQFNAVVASNLGARHLYEKLGFVQLGVIPGGFRLPDGSYADICPYYREL